MSAPVRASDQDLRALAAIVSQDRPDQPDGEGLLPPSLLADLMAQIRCDGISVERYDTGLQVLTWLQGSDADGKPEVPEDDDCGVPEDYNRVFGIACSAAIRSAPVTCVALSRPLTSTRPGNGTARACTSTASGRRGWSTTSA